MDLIIDGQHYDQVVLPTTVKIKKGFKDSHLRANALGYEAYEMNIDKKFNAVAVINLTNVLAWGIDAATGAIMSPDSKY